MKTIFLSLLLLLVVVASNSQITVHVIPHSHCDPGFVETVDDYYENYVRLILDGITDSLSENPDQRFHWVEISYLHIWWHNTTDFKRAQFKRLLENKQMEFLIGGWVMNDGALTTYGSNIEQMTHGHRFLLDTFGPEYGVPRIGWDIDPFGASQANARMYREMGFDYHSFVRINQTLKEQMRSTQDLDFIWKTTSKDSIFSYVLFDYYCSPWGFIWEFGDAKDAYITPQNIAARAKQAADIIYERAKASKSQQVVWPLGCDFEFRNPRTNFGNMTMLMQYLNSHYSDINIKYSLLSDYFKSVTTKNISYSSYDGDFFPYIDAPNNTWTGFFTSRPKLKHLIRISESKTRTREILLALTARTLDTQLFKTYIDRIFLLRSANGYAQHHDGITGTERVKVLKMYLDYLYNGLADSSIVVDGSLSALINSNKILKFSEGVDIQTNPFQPIILFNSLGWSRSIIVRLNVKECRTIVVLNEAGERVATDCVLDRIANTQTLIFESGSIQPMGYSTFFIISKRSVDSTVASGQVQSKLVQDITYLSNSVYNVQFCKNSYGVLRMCKVENKVSGAQIQLEQDLLFYRSESNLTYRASGAYIFHATSPIASPISFQTASYLTTTKFIHEVEQTIAPWANQTIRLYQSGKGVLGLENFIEIEFKIGIVPNLTEVVSRLSTCLETSGKFFTDNNGWMRMERTRGTDRPETDYYPIQYSAFIRDSRTQVTIITDQSRGGTSLSDGQLEIMLHRRTGDDFGFLGPLDDRDVITMTVRLIIDTPERSESLRRPQTFTHNFPVDVFTVDVNDSAWRSLNITSVQEYKRNFITSNTAVNFDLPSDLHLLTLQVHKQDPTNLLFRIHQIDDYEEATVKPTTLPVNRWFKPTFIPIQSAVETSLSANQVKSQKTQELHVNVTPTEIKTFMLNLLE